MWADARRHVEDFSRGEEAGFFVCSHSRHSRGEDLIAREWHPVPEEALQRGEGGYVTSWSAAFTDQMVQRAVRLNAGLVLLHSHGRDPSPALSTPDLRSARQIFPSISRLLEVPSGTVVIGDQAAAGRFWDGGQPALPLHEVLVIGAPIERWPDRKIAPRSPKARTDRQRRAIGSVSDALLGASRVAVIGCSGGGSHVSQQAAHMGVGTVVPLDDDAVEDVNLGRMVGSRVDDIGVAKVEVIEGLIKGIDPDIQVFSVEARFPSAEAIDALKGVDVVVSAVDSFLVREQINVFCRRYSLALIDIGMNIETDEEQLRSAHGQVICVLPDSPCLRCTPFLSDAVLERERRERPPGYDRNPNAGDPQVVSMNGTLASEACNTLLDLLTGYSRGKRGARWWQYNGRTGEVEVAELPAQWDGCPACAEAGHGDPCDRGLGPLRAVCRRPPTSHRSGSGECATQPAAQIATGQYS